MYVVLGVKDEASLTYAAKRVETLWEDSESAKCYADVLMVLYERAVELGIKPSKPTGNAILDALL